MTSLAERSLIDLMKPTTFAILVPLAVTACESGSPELKNRPIPPAVTLPKPIAQPAPTKAAQPTAKTGTGAKPTAAVRATPGDPLEGKFSMEDATNGLAGEGRLVAEMKTDKGKLECELWPDKAPITVANFVGLARGIRPWKDPKSNEWVKRPLYDGTPFHRVIKGFMVQGGDPKHNGSGGPGYVIPDEIWEGAKHDQRGLLCMANRGKNTNGSQFFILDGKAAHLDGGYTIFGKCTPDSVVEAIASTPVQRDRAVNPVKINSVSVKYR